MLAQSVLLSDGHCILNHSLYNVDKKISKELKYCRCFCVLCNFAHFSFGTIFIQSCQQEHIYEWQNLLSKIRKGRIRTPSHIDKGFFMKYGPQDRNEGTIRNEDKNS
jgi:hypothetical protein